MEASLITRLAGPSTGKAGLAKDQTEINRIIAEASRGSKFFENEKRKDKQLTEKIAGLLRHRDEVMRSLDVSRLEASIDKMMVELEAQRDLSQYIVHVDMDAFFAAVELLDNPSLIGKPFGVGKGVLTTASYEARLHGVRSGMPGFIAKKLCPQLVLVPIRGERYFKMSKQVMDVFRRYDPDMMVAGADEGYLNITPYCETHCMTPEECVQKLRADVFAETRLTVSAGIAPNKMLAKICSDKNKPNGQFYLPFKRDEILAFMKDLPIRKIPGIGRVSERLLDSIGVKTCGDIYTYRTTLTLLDKEFSVRSLLLTHLGIASNVVRSGQREERKSVGSERTFNPINDKHAILSKLENIAADLEEDMERTGWIGKTVTLKYKLDTFEVFTRAKSSTRYINRKEDLFAIGKELLLPELPLSLRLIGLRVTKLRDLRAPENQGLKRFFEPVSGSPTKKRQKMDFTVDEPVGEEEHSLEESMIDKDDPDQTVVAEPPAASDSGILLEFHPPSDRPRSMKSGSQHEVKAPSTLDTKHVAMSSHSTKIVGDASAPVRHEPINKPNAPKNVSSASMEELTCPICAKVLETNNALFNEHVDFCLSKGAILAATASTPTKKFTSHRERSEVGVQ